MNTPDILLVFLFIVTIYYILTQQSDSGDIICISTIFAMLYLYINEFNTCKDDLYNKFDKNSYKKNKLDDIKKRVKDKDGETACICKPPFDDETDKPEQNPETDKPEIYNPDKKDTSDIATSMKRHHKPVYSEENYKYNIFDEIGCSGDNKLAHKMKQTSNLNREAMDNFSRMNTKYSNINYFEQELKEHAARIWWDDETLEQEF